MIINTDDKVGNSVQLYNPITGNLKVLDQKEEVYNGLLWRKKSADLLVLRTAKDTLYKDDSFDILLWKGLNSPNTNNSVKVFNPSKHTNFPKNTKIKSRGVSFSDNGESIFFSTDFRASKTSKEKKDNNKTDDEAAEVEIWNSGDVDIIPAQKKNYALMKWLLCSAKKLRLSLQIIIIFSVQTLEIVYLAGLIKNWSNVL